MGKGLSGNRLEFIPRNADDLDKLIASIHATIRINIPQSVSLVDCGHVGLCEIWTEALDCFIFMDEEMA